MPNKSAARLVLPIHLKVLLKIINVQGFAPDRINPPDQKKKMNNQLGGNKHWPELLIYLYTYLYQIVNSRYSAHGTYQGRCTNKRVKFDKPAQPPNPLQRNGPKSETDCTHQSSSDQTYFQAPLYTVMISLLKHCLSQYQGICPNKHKYSFKTYLRQQ